MDAALSYADRGWQVLPLYEIRSGRCSCGTACASPGKHPRLRHGLEDASADPDKIKTWWDQWPNANIGIRTGRESNLWVIDVDTKKSVEVAPGVVIPEGESSLQALENDYGTIPDTLTSRTGSGGYHYLYEYPGDDGVYPNRAGFVPSVDIRGEGGYIVAPPSNHLSGSRYEWVDEGDRVIPAPRWIVEYQARPEVEAFVELDTVGEGGRNDYLYRYGASLLAQGRSHTEVENSVFGANYRICRPPLERGELEQLLRSLHELPVADVGVLDLSSFTTDPADGDRASISNLPDIPEGADLALPLWELIESPPDPLVPVLGGGILDEGNGFILAGPPNLGKTWIALDAALAVASGSDFLGKFPTTPGSVLIIDEEGSVRSAYNRMKMLLKGRELSYDQNIFYVIQREIKLDTPTGQLTVQRLVERYRPRLLILDSLVRLHGGDENSARDMARLFETPKRLQRAYGVAVMLLHHTRKPQKEDFNDPGNLIRGSGDIRGWPDGIFTVMPRSSDPEPGTGMTVYHTKSRDHERLDPFFVDLAIDDEDQRASVLYMGSKRERERWSDDLSRLRGYLQEFSHHGTEWVPLTTLTRAMDKDKTQIVNLMVDLENEGYCSSRSITINKERMQAWNLLPKQQEWEQ